MIEKRFATEPAGGKSRLEMKPILERVPPRRRLVADVAARLRRAILSRDLKPGERLPETELAAQLGVSRTPLREALRMLEQEALVVALPQGGVEVARLDAADADDLYELREVLDGLAARRLAAQGSREGVVGILRENVEQAKAALAEKDMERFTELNVSFHERIVEGSQNRWLGRFMPVIRMTIQLFYPVLASDVERAQQAVREHEAILEAIAGGDSEEAAERAREHARRAREALRKRLRAEEEKLRTGASDVA